MKISKDSVYIKNGCEFWIHDVSQGQIYLARNKIGADEKDGRLIRVSEELFIAQMADAQVMSKEAMGT